MLRKVSIVLVLLTLVSLAGCGSSAPQVDWTLKVSGGVSSPLSVTFADLAKMPQTDLKDVLMEKSRGEDTIGSWSGVLLTDLMAKAGAGEYATITAIAGDGYAIEVSKDELENAIIALKENSEWIATADPDHGPLRLVTPKTPANRWVFQLQEIQVNQQGGSGVPANAALKVTGNVSVEVGWTEEKVRSMDTIQAESTNKQGETKTYTGVLISDLIGKADPKDDATTVIFVADDGFTAEVPLADIEACQNCIVSFRDGGGFSTVLPGFANNVQVKGVVEIQIK
jgi:DMSO/TMAO reductase YedYZ molybdopterin-dependent catalytic subunit